MVTFAAKDRTGAIVKVSEVFLHTLVLGNDLLNPQKYNISPSLSLSAIMSRGEKQLISKEKLTAIILILSSEVTG